MPSTYEALETLLTPESPLDMARRQKKALQNQALTDSQYSPGAFVNNSPFQQKFMPQGPAVQKDLPSWEKALRSLSIGLQDILSPTTPEGLPAAGLPGKPGRMQVEREGKKFDLLSSAPSKSGKTVQTTVGENSTLSLNPVTGRASLSDGKISDLAPAQRFSLILQKKLTGVPLTKEDERILAEWESRRK